jgi:hypothetical protein
MTYDCRKTGQVPGAARFPGPVKIIDPATGERIPNVFFLDTSPAQVGRFITDAAGQPMVDAKSRRVISEVNSDTGRPVRRIVFDRLELWEHRPWAALAPDGGVVARSEGVG